MRQYNCKTMYYAITLVSIVGQGFLITRKTNIYGDISLNELSSYLFTKDLVTSHDSNLISVTD